MHGQHECPDCHNYLIYQENVDCYFCPTCQKYYDAQTLDKPEDNMFTGVCNQISCKMCGKITIVKNNYDYGVCPFCYNNLVDIVEGVPDFKPKFMIPFKDTKESLTQNLQKIFTDASVPAEITSHVDLESLKGVYLPFYQYVIDNNAIAFLQTAQDESRYTDNDYYFMMMSYFDSDEVLIDTTRVIDNDTMSRFADFDFSNLVEFSPEKIEDFYMLKPQYGGDLAWAELKKVVKEDTEKEMKKYQEPGEVLKELKAYNDIKTDSRRVIIVPVWMLDFIKDGERHVLYINGQTYNCATYYEFAPMKTKGIFKKKVIDYQFKVLSRSRQRHEEFNSSIDYLNSLKKYEVNKNDRSAEIRKVR